MCFFQSNHTGIETSKFNLQSLMTRSSNRTILELKRIIEQEIQKVKQLPIEPYWNWNLHWNDRCLWSWQLPIEPYWNWNGLSGNFPLTISFLPIEPYWNWNATATATKPATATFQSNHTGIETTAQLPACAGQQLPIEPYWNWNHCAPDSSGILFAPSNRTILELKQHRSRHCRQ